MGRVRVLDFGRFIAAESERWGALAKAVGARLE